VQGSAVIRAFAWLGRSLLCLALVAPAFAAPPDEPTLPAAEWKAIQNVIESQLAALKKGDGAMAMTYAAPGIQMQFGTPENFLRMVQTGYAPLLDARYTVFLEGAIIEGAAIQPMRLVLPDNTVLVALYRMQRMPDGRWRIAGCRLAPSTVQAA
jgi:hypothetical protein